MAVSSHQEDHEHQQQRLMDAFNFGPDEIEANRHGKLTDRQRPGRGPEVLVIIVACVIVLLVSLGFLVRDAGIIFSGSGVDIGSIAWPIFFAAASVIVLVGTLTQLRSSTGPEVKSVRGPVHLSYEGDGSYYLIVKKQQLNIQQHQKDVFITGYVYRVFYLPTDARIVSVVYKGHPDEV